MTGRYGVKTNMREALARVKAILDVEVLRRKPKFLGEPIEIGQQKTSLVEEDSREI